MPYSAKKTGKNEITVTKKDTGEVIGHTTPAKYNDYMAALHMHEEPDHMCHGGCAGYAEGGAIPEPQDIDSQGIQDATASDFLLPLMGLPGAAKAAPLVEDAVKGIASKAPQMLADESGYFMLPPGLKAGESAQLLKLGDDLKAGIAAQKAAATAANTKKLLDAQKFMRALHPTGSVGGYAEGGVVTAQEEKDPSVIPEDIKEYVKAVHKAQNESRPDENWRVAPRQSRNTIDAPYKPDEDAEAIQPPDSMLKMADGGIVPAGFNKGGRVPGYADGGDVNIMDTNDDLQSMQNQAAARQAALLSSVSQPNNADLAAIASAGGPSTSQGDNARLLQGLPEKGQNPAPAVPSVPSASANAPSGLQPTAKSGVVVPPTSSGSPSNVSYETNLTDQDYLNRANRVLGLNPQEQAGFLKMLGQKGVNAQIGAGIAGLGDAIASGGTLGKVNPGGMQRAEDYIQNREKAGIEGEQMIRGNQEKAEELSQKLQAQDPNSPLSKYAQKAYGDVGKKIGVDLSHASAALIADVTGKGVQELSDEAQLAIRKEGLDIQRGQLSQTIENNRLMRDLEAKRLKQETENQETGRDIEKSKEKTEAVEKLGTRSAGNELLGLIPGTGANLEKKTLEAVGSGAPYGLETTRNGKVYEWSPETQKYHLKQ